MADYTHMTNIIQGEVLRIEERRPLEARPELFQELIEYLQDQTVQITISRLKATQELSEG